MSQNLFSLSRNLFVISLFLLSHSIQAQKIAYNLPKSINKKNVRVIFQKVRASSNSYYINYKAENIGNGTLIIDRSLTALEQNDGEIFPTSGKYVLKSGDYKAVYNQFRIKSPAKANADLLQLKFRGFSYAKPFSIPLKSPKLVLAEKATQVVKPFTIKVVEYNVYPDRVYAQIKCTFNGGVNSIGNIDLTKLKVNGGKAEVVKKGDILFPGKSYTFSINITPNGEELNVVWKDVLSVSKIQQLSLEKVIIKSTTYVEPVEENKPKEEEEEEESDEVTEETDSVKELSFTDFMTLKKDLELEMNNGGKPVGMAYEFLLEKKHISTAQVIEFINIFNLDGLRLKFAKMAYQFTSDKPKYHMVVGKLQYTKNKQALEEFLENI
ncbi:DUF4476 domain-containing protein [Aquimarina sp. 2201CG5-10]|uniref:DUF4476 domain-containing protein n=1 Tax=Aquimarina callyspongiae TaxID=3098150 RepID=UPI002AB49F31|nr:DUF4476 domain-containing protein [Aquimarina sp. 2201CG5-10]MDY8135971.1 DUF4476 domain-containing protein [Aquimarina sp. 2201CG5-10]